MSKEENIQEQWDAVVAELSSKFADGDVLNIDSILYLIGLQELGKGVQDFTKDDKINLMHIAVCCLLEPYGYYEFTHRDTEDWPHYKLIKELPHLQSEQQAKLMKEAIIGYFTTKDVL